MNNENIATINGLMDGISVFENDNTDQQLAFPTDKIYNDQEPYSLNVLSHQGITQPI